MRVLKFITGNVIFKLRYNLIYQLKTTIVYEVGWKVPTRYFRVKDTDSQFSLEIEKKKNFIFLALFIRLIFAC